MKDVINKINLIASFGFAGLGLFQMIYNGNFSGGLLYIGLSVFLLLTVIVYSLFLHMKKQAHKTVALIFYIKDKILKDDEESMFKNKVMSLIFLVDCFHYKKNKETLSGSSWAWQNQNPINPIVSSFFSSSITERQLEYKLTDEDKTSVDFILEKTSAMNKIEVDDFMLSTFPSLLNKEEKKIINFETV